MGSLAFIYTRFPDPDGNRWFVQPGYVGHERMTNSAAMLQALFGPEAERVAGEVVAVSDVYANDGHGSYAPTGATREVWDWWTIRRLARRQNLFGRSGTLCGHRVVMVWPRCTVWEENLPEALRLLGIGAGSEALVVVGDSAQYRAQDFLTGGSGS